MAACQRVRVFGGAFTGLGDVGKGRIGAMATRVSPARLSNM